MAKQPAANTAAKIAPARLRIRLTRTWQRVVVRTPGHKHRAFRLTRPRLIHVTSGDIAGVWRLLNDTWRFVFSHKRILLGLGALYAVLAYVLVGGISQVDYVAFKNATQDVMTGDLGATGTALALFGAAVTGNLTSPPGPVQQFLSAGLLLFFWLSTIWATRMLSADKEIRLRDALYNSDTPMIPTLVVLAVIAVQLVPATVGVFAYATVNNGGWLHGGVESMTFAAAAVLLCLLSAYFMVSSLTALIVVALPGTYPWHALRTARGLVMNRRWAMVLRVLALLLYMLVIWAVVLIPTFLLDNWLRFSWLPLVPVAVQTMGAFTLVFSSVYIYKLYRLLL